MPVFLLSVKAEQEGIASWGVKDDDTWCVTVQQGGGEEQKPEVFIDPSNEEEVDGTRGTFNFVCSFPGSNAKATINVLERSDTKCKSIFQKFGEDAGKWTAENAEKWGDDGFVPIVAFEMRGCDIVDWHPKGQNFYATSEGGTRFDDVELHEDWCDYDEANDASVQIEVPSFQVDRV